MACVNALRTQERRAATHVPGVCVIGTGEHAPVENVIRIPLQERAVYIKPDAPDAPKREDGRVAYEGPSNYR